MAQNIISSEQLSNYHRDGFLVLSGLFTADETAQWKKETERLLGLTEYHDPNNLRVGYRTIKEGTAVIERYDPFTDISVPFADLARDERITGPLSDIFSEQAMLFKDKLIFKLPGVSGYTMHQDAAWWHGFPVEDLISVMVAIDGADRENGGLELFPGYHDHLISPPGQLRNMNNEEVAQIDPASGKIVETKPGDLIIFHSFTPHQSGVNTANRSRRQIYFTYSSGKHGSLYEKHYEHYHNYSVHGKTDSEKQQKYFE